jgi:tRNA (adenine22-N1)-methyltransferase
LAQPGLVYLDLGADHGLLAMALAEQGFKVYASENKRGPFTILKDSLLKNNSSVICYLADGLTDLPKDVGGVFILGMGGKTMTEILSRHPSRLAALKQLVIEPQSDAYLPIHYLLTHGFKNDKGRYVFEKHAYPLLSFVPTADPVSYSREEETFGPCPLAQKDPLLGKLLQQQLERLNALAILSPKAQNEKTLLAKAWTLWNS